MKISTASIQIAAGAEPISGYTLEEKIGAGGYGEVWRASAPGGLLKAVKFVFGAHDEERATREFTSLNRVKQLQHPFLLSLERIETISGQLVIVTELANCNMKQLFDEIRSKGKKGIPREQLLSFISDAADALDFLYQQESLQHLDVKPENLLVVGSHVKVSDFGLVKDLDDNRSISLVEGLTPKYSPPEMFDNQPSKNSDQYSLAIVYQEMLTGELPFNGVTTAQLAAQHLNAAPNLSSLPPADRFAVDRALSKSPNKRFESCREFVRYLLNPPRNASVIVTKAPERPRVAAPQFSDSDFINDGQTQAFDCTEARTLAPISIDTNEFEPAPALFLGIGGIAAKVVKRLGRRLEDRFGDLADVPVIQTLLLDTDNDVTSEFSEEHSATNHTVLNLPLRKPEDYRRANLDQLNSISRRWIYNIPRTRKTEGLRALGRLAFLDHSPKILEQLRRVLREITSHESIESSSEATGLAFSKSQVRVYVVASISGGTGGGMVLDVGYAVRQILAELCLDDDNLHGILLNAIPSTPSMQELASLNTYSCLTEMLYFGRSDTCYPGEPTLDLSGFQEDKITFTNTYIANVQCDEAGKTDEEVRRVADYIYLSSSTRTGAFFDEARRQDQDQIMASSVQTFGLHKLTDGQTSIPDRFASRLCRVLASRWRSGPEARLDDRPQKLSSVQKYVSESHALNAEIEEEIRNHFESNSISIHALKEEISSETTKILEAKPEEYFTRIIEDGFEGDAKFPKNIIASMDAVLGTDHEFRTRNMETIPSALESPIQEWFDKRANGLESKLLSIMLSSELHVEGSQHAAKCAAELIAEMQTTIGKMRTAARLASAKSRDVVLDPNFGRKGSRWTAKRRRRELTTKLLQYALNHLDEIWLTSIRVIFGKLEAVIASVTSEQRDAWRDLGRFRDQFPLPPSIENCDSLTDDEKQQWMNLLEFESEMLSQLNSEFRDRIGSEDRGIKTQVFDGQRFNRLTDEMRSLARKAALEVLRRIQRESLHELIANKPDLAKEFIAEATPSLNSCGGHKRLMLISSEDFDAQGLCEKITKASGEEATIVQVVNQDCFLCYESNLLPLNSVANHVIQHRSDLIETAHRLHTRTDLDFC